MCAQFGGPAPTFHNVLIRDRLLDKLGRGSAGPTLICAPSGQGKTVLAAQLASCFDVARWIDCHGERPDSLVLHREVMQLLGAGSRLSELDGSPDDLAILAEISAPVVAPPHSKCLVLDDMGFGGAAQGVETLWLVTQILSQGGCSLLITSREELTNLGNSLHHYGFADPLDLRLTLSEAEELAQRRSDVAPNIVACIWEETAGHAAFFMVMLHASSYGCTPSLEHPRLSAWINHLVSAQIAVVDQTLLRTVCLLGKGKITELSACAIEHAAERLLRMSQNMPLIRVVGPDEGSVRLQSFIVHDLLVEHVLDVLSKDEGSEGVVERAIDVLMSRPDVSRVARVIHLCRPDRIIDFLSTHGFECERMGEAARLAVLFAQAPLVSIMAKPRLLLLWADVLLDCDEFEEAYSKARAARVLAEHDSDLSTAVQAIATALDALRLMNRWDEASSLLAEGRNASVQAGVPDAARAAISRAGANMLILAGHYGEAERLLREALSVDSHDARFLSDLRESSETLALIPCFARGDMFETIRALSPWAALDEGRIAQRIDSRGNLAVALVEAGRIERATALLRQILPVASISSLVSYLPVLGCAEFADGRETEGLRCVADGIRTALQNRFELEAAQNRVFQAMLLRAAGLKEESLTSAERGYERLCVQDFIDFRRLAALEVAASLLALGDPAAARAWAEPTVAAGFGENAHHAFRAAMILAECDRVEGRTEDGIARIGEHVDHIASENSNFQAAMYSRAFPDILGMITAATGAAALPVHMLRMIPPEAAERTLRASRHYLDSAEWATLGERLLGVGQFDSFVERKGKSICRVRVFGGLEITVGDRALSDRDWKKRKARTLFAMMVLNRGQEIPREQLLDHVWPELPEDRAKNNFYVAWSAMKSALMGADVKVGPCPYIENTAGRCRIVTKSVRSDIDEFEEFLASGRDAEAAGDVDGAIDSYERLSAVYRGELLPGDLYDDWFSPYRDRYRFEFLAAMLRLVDLLLEKDDPCNALVFARRALHIDPYREDLYQATLRCQIAAGQRSAAVETFVQCKTNLSEELGLDPSAETMALYQEVLVMEERPRYDTFNSSR